MIKTLLEANIVLEYFVNLKNMIFFIRVLGRKGIGLIQNGIVNTNFGLNTMYIRMQHLFCLLFVQG